VFRRVERKLVDREPAAKPRRFVESAPILVAMAEASARGVVATGPRRGCRIVRVRGPTADVDAFVMGRLCAQVEGYNLQAATRVGANDRDGLERMGRYLSRPPIATDRLSQLDDQRFELRLKRPWRDGTTAFIFTPHELIERLVAQVPRPRAHLIRYHGVLALAFAARSQIVPYVGPKTARRGPKDLDPSGSRSPKRPGRFPWASLIWRVFLTDVLECRRCSGRMEIVVAVTSRGGRGPNPGTHGVAFRRTGLPPTATASAGRTAFRCRRIFWVRRGPAGPRRFRALILIRNHPPCILLKRKGTGPPGQAVRSLFSPGGAGPSGGSH
jgi:hypothetical protein